MSLTPLDLQMMFSQIDKYAKDIHAQREGAQLHKAMEAAVHQKIEEEKSKTVHEANTTNEGLQRLGGENTHGGGERGGQKKSGDEDEDERPPVRDPNLGRFVDLSG